MSNSKMVFVGGTKGGSTKTTTAHQICLGAILNRQPAAYVLTDPDREPRSEGRPYGVIDGRDTDNLSQIIKNHQTNTRNGWLVIDGGGNRPVFDKAIAKFVPLMIVPFRDSDEDTNAAIRDLSGISNAFAWPSAWPTNPKARTKAEQYITKIREAFPLRVILPVIDFHNSTKELVADTLGEPSTVVRLGARNAFGNLRDFYEERITQLETTERDLVEVA